MFLIRKVSRCPILNSYLMKLTKTASGGLWWPILAKFNLNRRRNFKPHLNFIFDMKIKSMFTFQIDIRNQIDLYFYLHSVFHNFS